jgi:hypothetical protein
MVWTANPDGLLEYVNRHWSDYTGVLYPEDREPT